MKKYFPIRIFSLRFGYGWWWGTYFFFFGKHATAFAIMPMSAHHGSCIYEDGKAIEDGMTHSWHPEPPSRERRGCKTQESRNKLKQIKSLGMIVHRPTGRLSESGNAKSSAWS